jgi:hypothetical protein
VDSVRIRSITLDITNPSSSSSYFNFLDEIVFYISADALPQQEIGRLSPVPSRLTEVELNVSSIDIVDYLLSESMTITTQASGIAPKEALTVRATVDLDVDVDVTAAAGCQVAPY